MVIMKGLSVAISRTRRSVLVRSTCFARFSLFFFRTFMAYVAPLSLFSTSSTLPNDPLPSTFIRSKSDRLTLSSFVPLDDSVELHRVLPLSPAGGRKYCPLASPRAATFATGMAGTASALTSGRLCGSESRTGRASCTPEPCLALAASFLALYPSRPMKKRPMVDGGVASSFAGRALSTVLAMTPMSLATGLGWCASIKPRRASRRLTDGDD
mmetsp:Transcript_63510/g.175082  ORF Transcript_63510/g.175082 Transcript_63510/m.175082 type:complete len:212 (-) Transcript_63510:420-1055(-)